jgi:hypothetical protein
MKGAQTNRQAENRATAAAAVVVDNSAPMHQRVDRNRRGIGSRTLAIEGVPHLRCLKSHLARIPALTHGANFWCASGAKALTGPTKSEAGSKLA